MNQYKGGDIRRMGYNDTITQNKVLQKVLDLCPGYFEQERVKDKFESIMPCKKGKQELFDILSKELDYWGGLLKK